MPTIKTRRAHLADWVAALGADRDRTTVTSAEIVAQLARWQRARPIGTGPLAGSTLNHRRDALAHLYRTLNPGGSNPARAVAQFREPPAEPRGLPPYVVQAILEAMGDRDVKPRKKRPQRRVRSSRSWPRRGCRRRSSRHCSLNISHASRSLRS